MENQTMVANYRWATLAFISLATLAVLGSGVHAAKSSADMVKIESSAGKIAADGTQEVTFTLNIEDGWHIYANPVDNEDLTSAQTKVTITGKTKPKDVKIEYPKGKIVEDKTLGNYSTYEGKVVIKAKVSRAKDDTGPLDVAIKLQACNEKLCLPPSTVKLEVK
jgi:DsbC/DsbD-like thiol-disulfide interchange protein